MPSERLSDHSPADAWLEAMSIESPTTVVRPQDDGSVRLFRVEIDELTEADR